MTDIQKLLREVESYYKKEGRQHLPWRKTRDPYKILVSEVMLQQTQVDRVLPFYKNFLKEFPNTKVLAKAPLSKVLKVWQGLGYNRRAKYLQEAAKLLSEERVFSPLSTEFLESLPGVGPYTAKAVATFAYNSPEVFIETNIRTIFFYFCFKNGHVVSDQKLIPLVQEALDKTKLQPREFYQALMDYGSYLKRKGIKLNKQSKHYVKQSKFEGSARQLRGAILRELLKKPQTKLELRKNLSRKAGEVQRELERLQKEGLVVKKGALLCVS